MHAERGRALGTTDIERYLHQQIPLSRAMGVRVDALTPSGLRLTTPLAPNLNHRGTAFGGSVASLAILAGWSWLLARLADRERVPRLVIQQQTVEYVLPINADFEATCAGASEAAWRRFLRALDERGRGRLELSADVTCGGRVAARFRGLYVAVADASA